MSSSRRPLPKSQTVILQNESGVLTIQKAVPLPVLPPGRMLVKVSHVALNPCDYKMPLRFPTPGCLDGHDFSGTIVALGPPSAATKGFALGDRVCGAVHASNPIDKTTGAFAEYVSADAEFTLKVPKGMGMDQAAAIGGTGMGTMGLMLKECLGLDGSPEKPVAEGQGKEVLVYAASTSIGTLALQLLSLSGHKPIAVCSPKNFPLVKSRGAVEVFDYHSTTCAADIRSYTKNRLAYIIDPMVEARTMQLCYDSMGRLGGKYCCLEMYHEELRTRKVVKPQLVMGMAILGREVQLDDGYGVEASPDRRRFGIEWFKAMQKVLDEGKLKWHPVRLLPGRWEAILEGLRMLKNKEVSGEKLVVKIE